MTSLLSISLGPVQEFIAAARRTGDLRAGSRLLVSIAQEVAGTVRVAGGELIFPADPDVIGSNKILARLPEDNPAEVAAKAAEGARRYLEDVWSKTWPQKADHLSAYLDASLARDQIRGFLEFYAAWWPLGEDYGEARRNVERLLAGRKALRNFDPPPKRAGRPKSPLDPSRDCVLLTDQSYTVPQDYQRTPLWLKPRETLDAVSLLKRLLAEPGVPSTSLMAVRSVLPEMRNRAPDSVRKLEGIAKATDGALDLGDLFFPQRLEEAELQALGLDSKALRDLRRAALVSVGLREGEAPAYYAILVADGDRMGKLIDAQSDMESHRKVATTLADFAKRAARTIDENHGFLVYSGGDDALTLLPVNTAVECARKLRGEFGSRLDAFRSGGRAPSLSAGIAIVHHLTPLQAALEYARAAERLAKRDRDSLAVALHVRGGAPLAVSLPWDQVSAWDEWITAFRAGLSRGVPYELSTLAREWKRTNWPDQACAGKRLGDEVKRIFGRKEGGKDKAPPVWMTDATTLERFASLLAITRFLSRFGARAAEEQTHG